MSIFPDGRNKFATPEQAVGHLRSLAALYGKDDAGGQRFAAAAQVILDQQDEIKRLKAVLIPLVEAYANELEMDEAIENLVGMGIDPGDMVAVHGFNKETVERITGEDLSYV